VVPGYHIQLAAWVCVLSFDSPAPRSRYEATHAEQGTCGMGMRPCSGSSTAMNMIMFTVSPEQSWFRPLASVCQPGIWSCTVVLRPLRP
jgi:hypothetical protein